MHRPLPMHTRHVLLKLSHSAGRSEFNYFITIFLQIIIMGHNDTEFFLRFFHQRIDYGIPAHRVKRCRRFIKHKNRPAERSALATIILCAWPKERFLPFSSITVAYPSGSSRIVSCIFAFTALSSHPQKSRACFRSVYSLPPSRYAGYDPGAHRKYSCASLFP